MSKQTYHYAIIGAGLAGLQLAMAFAKDPFFDHKHIVLIDPISKTVNDKTWCFWEKGKGNWEDLVSHRWEKGQFISKQQHINFDLQPYQYKKIESLAFYQYAHNMLRQHSNIHFMADEVKEVQHSNQQLEIITTQQSFKVNHAFDSRIDADFYKPESMGVRGAKGIKLWQPFKGWVIRFKEAVFNPDKFTMMDYRLQHENSTSFTYVLPFNTHEALVEFTLFIPALIENNLYDGYLKKYISTYISKQPYEITSVEEGVIPMTTYPFHTKSNHLLTKIGTAGGWVRPSTGYAFKYTEKYVAKIIENLKAGKLASHQLIKPKTRFYDTLLLDILHQQNHLGPLIFEQMYQNNPIDRNFRFLDGETTLTEELQLCSSVPVQHFLKALQRWILGKV